MKRSSSRISPLDSNTNICTCDSVEDGIRPHPYHIVDKDDKYAIGSISNIAKYAGIFLQNSYSIKTRIGIKEGDLHKWYYNENSSRFEITASKKLLGSILIQLTEIVPTIKHKSHHLPNLLQRYFKSDVQRITLFNNMLESACIEAVGAIAESEQFAVLATDDGNLNKASQLLCSKYTSICMEVKDATFFRNASSNLKPQFEGSNRVEIQFIRNDNNIDIVDMKIAGHTDDVWDASKRVHGWLEKYLVSVATSATS